MEHYTYFQHLTPDANWQKLIAALMVGGTLIVLGKRLSTRLASEKAIEQAVVPDEKMSVFGVFDLITETFVNFHDSILGKENRQYVPFSLSIFLFIFVSNLLGLVPGMPAITTTVWVNVALAISVFIYFNYEGIRAHGAWAYLKHFCGPVIYLAPLILPIELFSSVLRILTLNLRLYWNITGDHLVLGVFTQMAPYVVPCIFYIFGTFVAFMQAFVFTILTMIYILLATVHEEEH
ncbi:MAG: F0F1 ATP synthase subunit A [Deltaproteobacteria bacterium]|nr:F0F1 ATP synthase subunit A [Deltaproteobacteria bacterium]